MRWLAFRSLGTFTIPLPIPNESKPPVVGRIVSKSKQYCHVFGNRRAMTSGLESDIEDNETASSCYALIQKRHHFNILDLF